MYLYSTHVICMACMKILRGCPGCIPDDPGCPLSINSSRGVGGKYKKKKLTEKLRNKYSYYSYSKLYLLSYLNWTKERKQNGCHSVRWKWGEFSSYINKISSLVLSSFLEEKKNTSKANRKGCWKRAVEQWKIFFFVQKTKNISS